MSEYYNDQDERDYYDRSMMKAQKSCLFSFKALTVLTIIFFLLMFAFSCAGSQPVATLSTGTVYQVDGDRVFVVFKVVSRNYADQAVNVFYIPGHRYQERDFYPDPSKDPNISNHE